MAVPAGAALDSPSDHWLAWAVGQRSDVREDLRLDLGLAGVRCAEIGLHTLRLDRPPPGPADARFTLALARITDAIVAARIDGRLWDREVARLEAILREAAGRGHPEIVELVETSQSRLARRRARWRLAARSWSALRAGALSDESIARALTASAA